MKKKDGFEFRAYYALSREQEGNITSTVRVEADANRNTFVLIRHHTPLVEWTPSRRQLRICLPLIPSIGAMGLLKKVVGNFRKGVTLSRMNGTTCAYGRGAPIRLSEGVWTVIPE